METLLQLDPAKVQAEDNSRFGLKKTKVDSLKESIIANGGVLQPVIVEPLTPPVNGFTHRLIAGFYRHKAVAELNSEQAAGLTLPATVRTPADSTERLRAQLAENMDRENMSPMDSAVAIKKLMDAGVSRIDIRKMFARPTGKKGVPQPASNSWMNIVLRFLELPKSVQSLIHEGVIGVEAAYELGKVTPEKRQAVIDRALAERERQAEIEAKDEEKYLQTETKLQEAVTKEQEASASVQSATEAISAAEQLQAAKIAALEVVKKTPYLELDEKGKAELKEKLKAAEADVKGAEKAAKDAKNALAKVLETKGKAAEQAKALREKLEAARKAVKAPKKPNAKEVKKQDIKKAAKAEGVDTGAVPLTSSEMKDAIHQLTKVAKDYPKAAKVGELVKQCFAGVLTPKQMVLEVAKACGDTK